MVVARGWHGAQARPVTTGIVRRWQTAQILCGRERRRDMVIIAGGYALDDGTKVKIGTAEMRRRMGRMRSRASLPQATREARTGGSSKPARDWTDTNGRLPSGTHEPFWLSRHVADDFFFSDRADRGGHLLRRFRCRFRCFPRRIFRGL